MEVEQTRWSPRAATPARLRDAQLVLVFGARGALRAPRLLDGLRAAYPRARIVGASTAGEIAGTEVLDGSVVVTAVRFEATRVGVVDVPLDVAGGAYEAGAVLGRSLPAEGLVHALVFADGTHLNGTELVRGLRNELPPHVQVTGGLAGDGTDFRETLVMPDGPAVSGHVCVVGLYGARLRVSYGGLGGWDPFGPARTITRSAGNVLYELDGRPAPAVYKEVLGEKAAELPASGLLHPLLVRTPTHEFVRTPLHVDEAAQSMTFAGDVPQGRQAFFMRADVDRLIAGAEGAAQDALGDPLAGGLGILVSCVGRKLVLGERAGEELAAVAKVLGGKATLCGFYGYGQICPVARDANCTLHNQTMTVTVLREE